MTRFIVNNIKSAAKLGGVEAGKEKYKKYFVDTPLYKFYKKGVDELLTAEGFKTCIVG